MVEREESANMLEMDHFGSSSSQIAAEIGMTRRRRRSFKAISGNRRTVITELPSRNNANSAIETVIAGGDGQDSVEAQADKIIEQIQQTEEMEDDASKSVKDHMETLREMTQSLTLKRTVRTKLIQTLARRTNSNNISMARKVGHTWNVAAVQMNDTWKEMVVYLEPWYQKLKTIEGHFGSGVATYFKFLRSLFFINSIVFLVSLLFVVVPQLILVSQRNATTPSTPFTFGNLFTGEGYLSESVLFYGYYANETLSVYGVVYSLPSAYFFSALVSYFLVFLLLSISMAASFRKSFIENQGSMKNIYASKVFCAWDFGIATDEAADLKAKSIHTEFKELLAERNVASGKKTFWHRFYLLGMQLSLNLLLLSCLAVASYYTWLYLSSHDSPVDTPTAMTISLSVTIVIHLAPMFLIWILRFEEYESPRTATYVTIARTFVLDAVLIGVLVAYRLNMAKNNAVCWETALGQEIYRLVLLDFLVGLVGTSLAQFVRRLLYQKVWTGIGYPEMDVARNTINLLYNEALFFVGLYFSPILALVIIIKLFMTFYIRYWGAVQDCRPSERMWRAAQTQTVFLSTAFIAFILVVILYGYILSSVKTSMCGPFRGRKITYNVVVDSLAQEETSLALHIILYIRKPGVVAVLLIIMLLGVYYLRAVGRARARVVRILNDVLHLQAKDKEYLLQMLSQFSSPKPEPLAVRFRSEHELRSSRSSPASINRRRSFYKNTENLKQLTIQFLQAEREALSGSPRLRFNPVYTESVPAEFGDYTPQRVIPDQTFNVNDLNQSAKYTPLRYDERVPSRIAFPELSSPAKKRI